MNKIIKHINLNVNEPVNYPIIHAMQGDNNTITVIATLYDLNKLYMIDDTVDVIRLIGTTPSGSVIDKIITEHTKHTVTFTLSENMLAVDGELILTIVLCNSTTNDVLSTFPFCGKVSNAPMGQAQTSEITSMTDLVLEAARYAEDAKEYYEKAIERNGISITHQQNEPTDQSTNDYWFSDYE